MSSDPKGDREAIRRMVGEAVLSQIGGAPARPGPPVPSDLQLIDESARDVIAEPDVSGLPPGSKLLLRAGAIVTPAASDLIRERKIEILYRPDRSRPSKGMVVAIASDHGGFEMKGALSSLLDSLGVTYRDFGAYTAETVDYPDFAHLVAEAVSSGKCDLGIIIDGAGIGSCMAANKVPGIRAAMCYDEATAKNSREHNYANILTLGARMISNESMARIVKTWLETPEGEERHGRRVAKIMAIEKQYLR